jgi:hypothetical protein
MNAVTLMMQLTSQRSETITRLLCSRMDKEESLAEETTLLEEKPFQNVLAP